MSDITCDLSGLTAKNLLKLSSLCDENGNAYLKTDYSAEVPPSGFCPEFQAVYDSWTTKPTDADAAEMNTMVEKMITDGTWALCDVLYIFSVHANGANEALTNWKNPGTNDATLHGAVLPAFVAFEGFTGNSAQSAYINTNFNPNTEGVNYVLDDASAGIYIRNNTDENSFEFGCWNAVSGKGLTAGVSFADDAYIRVNSTIQVSVANIDSRGMYISNRTAANVMDLYRNKIKIIDQITASTGIPNFNIYLLCYNNVGTATLWSNRQASIFYAGGGMTTTNIDDMTDAFETWMDYKGKGVIP